MPWARFRSNWIKKVEVHESLADEHIVLLSAPIKSSPLVKKERKKRKKKAQLELYKARGDDIFYIQDMATNHPVYRLPFKKHQLLFGCHVSLSTEYSFQCQQWCLNLLCISSFLVCFVNQAVRCFQLVARHPAFFEIHKQPLPASKRQQPYDKLKASGCQSTIIHLL